MTEEEKKAIELLKKLQKKTPYIIWGDGTPYNKSNQIQTILNLIDNQQKEIEELKEKNKELDIENQGLFELYNFNDSSLLAKILKDYKEIIANQQKEIEEKSTIIMAGAEKVKQLEKGNRSLMESRIKWKNRYYKEKAKNKECISKEKIKEKIKEQRQKYFDIHDEKHSINEICFESTKVEGAVEVLKELLEEN